MSIPAWPIPHNPQVLEAEESKEEVAAWSASPQAPAVLTANSPPLTAERHDQQAGPPQLSLPTAHSPLLFFSNPQN